MKFMFEITIYMRCSETIEMKVVCNAHNKVKVNNCFDVEKLT